MKQLILLTLIFGLQLNAHAFDCRELGEYSSDIFDKLDVATYERLVEKTLAPEVEFSAAEKELVLLALNSYSYESYDSWAQVERDFLNSWDDLFLLTFRLPASGTILNYVWSYPGDNEYGVILNEQGNVVARIGDGEISCL